MQELSLRTGVEVKEGSLVSPNRGGHRGACDLSGSINSGGAGGNPMTSSVTMCKPRHQQHVPETTL